MSTSADDDAIRRAAGAILTIDLGAIVANWRCLREPAARRRRRLRRRGQGRRLRRSAPRSSRRALAGRAAGMFFVAHLDGGLALRGVCPSAEIAVLNGLLPGTEAEFVAAGLTPGAEPSRPDRCLARGRPARQPRRRAVIHVDTGMDRLGLQSRGGAAAGRRARAALRGLAPARW